jgi:hypothetical protein
VWCIQSLALAGTEWTRAPGGATTRAVPSFDLTDLELETAARACRALAYQEGEAAKRLENPTVRAPIEGTARRAAALAEKFERARKGRSIEVKS